MNRPANRMNTCLSLPAGWLGALLAMGLSAHAPGADPAAPTRHYAPSREADLLHLALDVTPDFRQRTIAGQASLRFKPVARPLPELKLDAIDLTVTNLTATEKVAGWQVTRDKIIVTFDPPVPPGREATVVIGYRAQPSEGLYFRTREMGYPAADEHLWTQGEAVHGRHWFPCLDEPNEKLTTEVTCRVPEGMVVLSNGRKVSEQKADGLVAVRWLQDKPHANYLVALVAGHFKKLEDRHRDVPLGFWTVPSDSPQAASSFEGTRDMMAFFEQETGVPYPWARYDQVCVFDFTAGGMENTTLTVLNNNTLFTPATENLRSSEGLVAHELVHQWFGNLVTCKDWSQIWLNEGFATYYEHLYDERKHGREQFLYRMWQGARSISSQANDTRAIVSREYGRPDDLFDWRAYGKGAWVLHMLRHELGNDLYRRCIKTYLDRHQYGSVVTEDLNAIIEELSGRSFDQFFDQWVYHAGVPELEVDYAWAERDRLARLTVRQTQAVTDKVLLFRFPLTVRFKTKAGMLDRRVEIKDKSEDFYFPLAEAPQGILVDPDLALLAKVRFQPPASMLLAQLAGDGELTGRLGAVALLQSRKDHEAVVRLKEALNGDRFHGVRLEASAALQAIHTEGALAALLASTKQSDARVRRAVVTDIGRFYNEQAQVEMLRVVQEEKNPDIVAEALAALCACPKPEAEAVLVKHLRSDSYRNRLAEAAIRALRARQDPAVLGPVLDTVQRRAGEFTSHALAAGLDAVAWLARGQATNDAVREFLARQTGDPRPPVRLAAIAALGTLEDPQSMPILKTFASAAQESPERRAAERAMETIRAARKTSVELGDLRKEVLELQKQNRDLRRDFDALQKKIEASVPAKTNAPAQAPRPAGRFK